MIVKVLSRAKLNLFLYVTGRREDGYHTLCSLMVPITLCDEIELDFTVPGPSVRCSHPDVPEDGTNLVMRAVDLFYETAARSGRQWGPGPAVHIIKRIPVGGGLGGGSSNAACVLNALNQYHGRFFSKQQLSRMGLSLGADVPFFISGAAAVARGIGDILDPCPKRPFFHTVICDPGVSASTADVYKKFDLRLTENQKYNIKRSLSICSEEQGSDIRELLHNDLEEPACSLYPEIRSIKEEMELLLAVKVCMTGSGSSLFALFSDYRTADQAAGILEKALPASVRVLRASFG